MIYEIFEEMGWEWSLCMTYTYEIKEKNLFGKCKESRNFLPHFWVRGPVSEGAVVGSPTLASLPDWDPNLCLSLTNLISHHANAVPRQWLLSKSTFSRLLRRRVRGLPRDHSPEQAEGRVQVEPVSAIGKLFGQRLEFDVSWHNGWADSWKGFSYRTVHVCVLD